MLVRCGDGFYWIKNGDVSYWVRNGDEFYWVRNSDVFLGGVKSRNLLGKEWQCV